MSRIDMNMPSTIAKNAMSLRGSMRSSSTQRAGTVPAVAVAAIGPTPAG